MRRVKNVPIGSAQFLHVDTGFHFSCFFSLQMSERGRKKWAAWFSSIQFSCNCSTCRHCFHLSQSLRDDGKMKDNSCSILYLYLFSCVAFIGWNSFELLLYFSTADLFCKDWILKLESIVLQLDLLWLKCSSTINLLCVASAGELFSCLIWYLL